MGRKGCKDAKPVNGTLVDWVSMGADFGLNSSPRPQQPRKTAGKRSIQENRDGKLTNKGKIQPSLGRTYMLEDGARVMVVGWTRNLPRVQHVDDFGHCVGSAKDVKASDLVACCPVYDMTLALSSGEKFVAVPIAYYLLLKPIVDALVARHRGYIRCEIPRKKVGQDMRDYIVVALKDERSHQARKKNDTKGYAKRRLAASPDIKCCFCDCELTPDNATAEHIIPFSKCHNNSPANFAIACRSCNEDRGTDDFYEYMARKRRRELEGIYGKSIRVKRYVVSI